MPSTSSDPDRDARRLEDLRRTGAFMHRVRAVAVVFGLVQVLTYNAQPYPPGFQRSALLLVAMPILISAIAWIGWRHVATLGQGRWLAIGTVTGDTLVASGLVWVFSFDPSSAHWAILFLVPLLGAARFRLPGALLTWGGVTVLYTMRQAYAADRFEGIGFSPSSIAFRMGLAFLVALVAGYLARDLARQREATEEALAEVRRVDALRTHLIDGLAHDMRSPLTVITGTMDMLRRDVELDPVTERRLVDSAARQSRRLSRLVDGMLDLARLERGRLTLDRAPVPVEPLVEDARSLLADRGEEVVVEIPDGLTVHGDTARLEQVVHNLLSNALRHGDPPVRVAACRRGDEVVLTVRDAGKGVPPQLQPILFEPFATGGDASSIGLGLWLVRALVDAHGGRVSYHDAEGGGAEFEVVLPASDR